MQSDILDLHTSRWPDARNESTDSTIFVSQGARIEDTVRGETVWVPGKSEPSSYYGRSDSWAMDDIEGIQADWRLLHPRADKAIRMHGDWFWELRDTYALGVRTTQWAQALWRIESMRSNILEAATTSMYLSLDDERQDHRCYEELIYRPMLFDSEGRPKLPLGLQNHLRIWCCLESFSKNGMQNAPQGQTKGLDPPNVGWDGSAASFNRLKTIAGTREN